VTGKHAATRFSTYQQVHENRTEQFLREGFVLSEDLRFEEFGAGYISLSGTMLCEGGIVLDVEKLLEVVEGHGPHAMVQTVAYRYQAYVLGRGNILRYEGPHPTHNQFHHVHRYNTFGDGDDRVEPIETEDARPTLSEVLDELREFYYEHIDELNPWPSP
jgi:hypothetical protein